MPNLSGMDRGWLGVGDKITVLSSRTMQAFRCQTAKPVKEDVDLGALPRRRGLGPADQQSLQPPPHSFVPFADILAKTETSESQFSGGPMGMLLGYGAITII